jgi:glutathione S-transferase
MRLIGMLDSPYVRRVAVSLQALDLPYSHEPVSVLRQFAQFAAINPVVKAPTLITEEHVVLMDSTLILEYAERRVPRERRLMPQSPLEHMQALRVIGLALAACEKSVQIVYERNLRPADKQYEPWVTRVQGQLTAAYDLLENELPGEGAWLYGNRPLQADYTAAIAWRFTTATLPGSLEVDRYPALAALSKRCEALPEFQAAPYSD